jgi:CxxC-x17-CxxC domain-containing protein
MSSEDLIYLAEALYRSEKKKCGIRIDDRRRHVYVVGKTGMGKTALLKNMIIQDIVAGRGVGFVDPHGEAAEELLDFIPKERIDDVCYFNPADVNHPISFNVMEQVDVEYRHLVASGLMEVFKKIWPDVWSARMEYILNNTILALLECPNSTLLGVNRMLADANYRKEVVEMIKDPIVKAFWLHEFARYTQRLEVEATAAIQNKVGQFISAPLIRNIIGQEKSSVDMRKLMDEGKILILNLSKGRIGEDASKLLGGLLITKLQLAAMSRVDVPESERKDFFLYVDEFQNFATESFCNILSEARKYRLSLTLAHQYIAQMEEKVRDAIFGNVGTIITFRVGADDAEYLEKEFQPEFSARDLVNLPKYYVYMKLMVDGVAGRPFSAQTLPPFPKPEISFREQIIERSRQKYSTSRDVVERKIAEWTGNFVLESAPSQKTVELYDAKCENCQKEIKVPFKPEPGRPVYCKTCLKKIGKEKPEEKGASPNSNSSTSEVKHLTLEELLLKNPVPFGPPKKKKAEKEKKKEIDKEKLKDVLKETLEESLKELDNKEKDSEEEKSPQEKKAPPSPQKGRQNNEKSGKIEPGETISF